MFTKAEIKDGWGSLPKDADGVLIYPGDKLYPVTTGYITAYLVKEISLNDEHMWNVRFRGYEGEYAPWEFKHIKPIAWNELEDELARIIDDSYEDADMDGDEEAKYFIGKIKRLVDKNATLP